MRSDTPRVILLTGASSGIGAEVARQAARSGHRLVLTARRADRLEQVGRTVHDAGAEALIVATDLAEPNAPERLVAATIERFGGLDVLINNAGFGLPHLFARADPRAIERQLQVNFVAPILLTRLALPHLIERRGTVINVGSSITCVANPAFGAYGATKAGLAYFNDALRREVRHRGLRVCLVEPGPVATEFFEAMGIAQSQSATSFNPLRDPPRPWMIASSEETARRIVRLIDHPRRRISILRRLVWPYRVAGALIQAAPWIGDVVLSRMVQELEQTATGNTTTSPEESSQSARPAP